MNTTVNPRDGHFSFKNTDRHTKLKIITSAISWPHNEVKHNLGRLGHVPNPLGYPTLDFMIHKGMLDFNRDSDKY